MLITHDYRGYRIEVVAVRTDDRWDATVRTRRLFTEEKARLDTVRCQQASADLAEHRALVWAKRFVDLLTA